MKQYFKNNKDKILKISKIVFLILVVIFLAKYFATNIDDIKKLDFKMNWGVFALSMIFYFIYIRNIFCFLLVMFTLTPDKNALYITQMAA